MSLFSSNKVMAVANLLLLCYLFKKILFVWYKSKLDLMTFDKNSCQFSCDMFTLIYQFCLFNEWFLIYIFLVYISSVHGSILKSELVELAVAVYNQVSDAVTI